MGKRKLAAWASIVGGAIFVIAGITTWVIVSNTLADQKIVTSSDACLPDKEVTGPFTAYCQAMVINDHTMEITGGKTYAELDREDPNRAVAMDSAFLQASLFTSVVAFGVAFMAVVVGALFMLIGFALRPEEEAAAAPPSPAPAA